MRLSRALKLIVVALIVVAVAAQAGAAPPPKVTGVSATPAPNLAGHAATYTINFTTSSTGDLVTGNTITVTFPSGTVPGLTCGNASAFTGHVTVNGFPITAPVSIPSCLVVSVPVPAAAAAVIGNSSAVSVVMSNVIKNPTAGSKTLKVRTTKDTTDVKSAAYTIAANATPVVPNNQIVPPSPEDMPIPITLTGSDDNDDPLTFSISQAPAHGTLGPIGAPNCAPVNTCSADVTYTPALNYNGPDSFKYRVNDTVVFSALSAGNVSITVTPVDDNPDAVDDATSVSEDSGANTIAVLANDSDADGDAISITANTSAANGDVVCSLSSCTYEPDPGFFGSDSFTYTISDGGGPTDTATVFVEVTPTAGGGAAFELCAKTNPAWEVLSPPATTTTVPIWGFAEGDCDVAGPATLPGPQLNAGVGDEVTITVDNSLDENVSLELPGQNMAPDAAGTPPGEERTYTVTAGTAGTYLYESGNNRQTLAGLYGALIVGGSPSDAVLVLSEVDPAFNASPASYNLLNYAPKYWLINGKSYPSTAKIDREIGPVLLRYVNAGSVHHTMALLGLHQRVVAKDGYPVTYPYDVVGETIPAGATMDALVTLPAGNFPIYSRQLHLDNAGVPGGGMLTFLDPQPAAARPAELTLTLSSVRATAGARAVRVSARTVACSPCRATARLRVQGVWRALRMTSRNGRWVATFRGVASGRVAYQVRVTDVDSGATLRSARQSVRVG